MNKKIIILCIAILILILIVSIIFVKTNTTNESVITNNMATTYNSQAEEKIENAEETNNSNSGEYKLLEDIALEYVEAVKTKNDKDLEYDLNGDGKKETITLKIIPGNGDEIRDEYVLQFNGNTFEEGCCYPILYIADLNKGDNQLELIVFDDGPSDNPLFQVYVMENNEMKKLKFANDIEAIKGEEFYTNENGDFYVKGDIGLPLNPTFSLNEYRIENGKVEIYETKAEDISNIYYFIEMDDIALFAKDIEKVKEIIDDFHYDTMEDAMNDIGMKYIRTQDTFKILKILEDNTLYVELDDGTQGYVIPMKNNFAA